MSLFAVWDHSTLCEVGERAEGCGLWPCRVGLSCAAPCEVHPVYVAEFNLAPTPAIPGSSMGAVSIRAIDASSRQEVELVASRMRETLVEVLGESRGGSMYTPAWLIERVLFHVKVGVVLVAESDDVVVGHAMGRVEDDLGHFSTIFVAPASRRHGVAMALLRRVEEWFVGRGVADVRYYTDTANAALIGLFRTHGYVITETSAEHHMVKLTKRISS